MKAVTAMWPDEQMIIRDLKKYYRIRRILKEETPDTYQLSMIEDTIKKLEKKVNKCEEDFIIEAL